LIVGTAAPFGWLLAILNIPSSVADAMLSLTTNKYVLLLMINIFLLFAGMILETAANILILGPVLSHIAIQVGIHPLHFAIIMVVNLLIGLITPPVGLCIFGTVPLAKVPMERIMKAVIPFLLAELFVLGLITYVPIIPMYIPSILGYLK